MKEFQHELSPEARNIISSPVLQGSWYDFALLMELMTKAKPYIETDMGRTIAWDMGRFSADVGLNTVYRIFFKVADPSYIARKAPLVYKSYYSEGEMTDEGVSRGNARIHLKGVSKPDIRLCERLQGWMERSLELAGGKDVVLSHPLCMTHGDEVCEFIGKWE